MDRTPLLTESPFVMHLDDTWTIQCDNDTTGDELYLSDGRGRIHLGRTTDYLNVPDLLRDLVEVLLPKVHSALLHIDGQPALWSEDWLTAYATRNALPTGGPALRPAPTTR